MLARHSWRPKNGYEHCWQVEAGKKMKVTYLTNNESQIGIAKGPKETGCYTQLQLATSEIT